MPHFSMGGNYGSIIYQTGLASGYTKSIDETQSKPTIYPAIRAHKSFVITHVYTRVFKKTLVYHIDVHVHSKGYPKMPER